MPPRILKKTQGGLFIFSFKDFRPSNSFTNLYKLCSWVLLSALVGFLAGSSSALLLTTLEAVTRWHATQPWLLYFLPFSGIAIAFVYRRYGHAVSQGNNLLIDEIHNPQKIVPLRMAPLIFLSTLGTHLFGGSAGREGTAVQMGGALADQFNYLLKLNSEMRRSLLMAGVAAGFGSVFGTPLAGAIFGMEVLAVGRIRYQALLPCFVAAIIGDYICRSWGVTHTSYTIANTPPFSILNFFWCLLAGAVFGACAWSFSKASHRLSKILVDRLPSPTRRAFIGGALILGTVLIFNTHQYLGLSLPLLEQSFQVSAAPYDFILKMLFTILTLSSGFKGGEVTPLFVIGATLGSALAGIIPLPISLLAGMGFVAVFAGAANTPLACSIMALELFGPQAGIFTSMACVTSYLFSGHTGIYTSQKIEVQKHAS